MRIQPIRTDADHARALEQLESVWGAAAGTPHGDAAEILVTLIDAYEQTHHGIDAPDPIAAIRFRMEQSGYTNADLAALLGGRSRVSEVMSGKRGLSLRMIRKLSQQWGISAAVLIGKQPADAA